MTSSSASSERTGIGGGRRDLGMAQQDLLDLEGGDVLAAPADRVLQPVDELEIAVGLANDAVAGMEPQVPPGLDRLLGRAEIARREGEGRLGAQHQLARRAVRDLVVLAVDHARGEALEDAAHGAGLLVGDLARRSRNWSRSSRSRRAGAMPVRSANSAWKWPGTPGASAMRVRCARSSGCAARDSRIGTMAPSR